MTENQSRGMMVPGQRHWTFLQWTGQHLSPASLSHRKSGPVTRENNNYKRSSPQNKPTLTFHNRSKNYYGMSMGGNEVNYSFKQNIFNLQNNQHRNKEVLWTFPIIVTFWFKSFKIHRTLPVYVSQDALREWKASVHPKSALCSRYQGVTHPLKKPVCFIL